ncbi:MAG TPA: amidohydrolase family protein, partial [Candidatus Methylomirabilis sp.]
MYDLLFRQAMVVDGTGAPGFVADVALAGDRFVAVAPHIEGQAERVIRAQGLVLAPGFIDLHCHSDAYHLEEPAGEIKIRQGVTLEVVGNCGESLAPLVPERAQAAVDHCLGGAGRFSRTIDWLSYGQYTAKVEAARPVLNVAGLVGHGTVRVAVMGFANRPATSAELDTMAGLLDDALAAGAAGMSTGLYYAPGLFATTEEVIALARVVARRGGYYATHMRNEAEGLLEALEETLTIGRASGAPVHVSHLKAAGSRNWPKAEPAVAKIEAARREGLDVTCDVYPYHFSSTTLQAVIPPWALEGGADALVHRSGNDAHRASLGHEEVHGQFEGVGLGRRRGLGDALTLEVAARRRIDGRDGDLLPAGIVVDVLPAGQTVLDLGEDCGPGCRSAQALNERVRPDLQRPVRDDSLEGGAGEMIGV